MKKYTSYILFVIVSLFFTTFNSYSQVSLQGIINKYAVVDSIYPTKDTIEVADVTGFNVNDTVMIYQAKGSTVYRDTSVLPEQFGNIRTGLKQAGKYEIILIKDIVGNKIVFKAVLANSYEAEGLVQLIRVPYFERASINAEVTCKAWDGSSGGVLALMVSDTLFLNANINVTGKGFKGAVPKGYSDLGSIACSATDTSLYKSYYFNILADTVMAGLKGESVSVNDSAYIKGRGRWANGGGGGNGRYTGGGGGGANGPGGNGGAEDTSYCSVEGEVWKNIGGLGGEGLRSVQTQYDDSTIFLGGGGGSGAFISGFNATNGGNGGGVVILIVKNIKSNGYNVIANGESVSAVATASAGGGGGGGAVIFDVDSLFGSLSISTNGGQGGFVNSLGKGGPGGGGGGGAIFWNNVKPANVVNAKADAGLPGYINELYPGQAQPYFAGKGENGNPGVGEPFITVEVPLTGFLFNSITANQQVCYNSAPEILAGSNPRGGSGEFVFQWEQSPDAVVWTAIAGAKQRDYQPPALTDTIYYRRIVKSGAAVGDSITDISQPVEIIVHNKIQVNQIFGDDLIICINNTADTITGTTATFGGVGQYQYTWQYTYDFNSWSTIPDLNDTICLPGVVLDTTFIRRKVNSGACIDYSDTITIIGLPLISNNIISENQEICYGDMPEEITGAALQGGLGTSDGYKKQWQLRTETTGWANITGEVNENLMLPNLYETTYYRRIVDSDDCSDTSNVVKINVLPLIGNNGIENSNPVFTCYNTAPELLTGTSPSGGDNSYTYQWQDSIMGSSWSNISDNAENVDYQAIALTDTTFYRRIVKSGLNDCCVDTSDFIKVKIHDLPIAAINNVIDTVCSGTDVGLVFNFEKGKQPYILTYSNGEEEFTPSAINNPTATINVSPETTNTSKEYNYTVIHVIDGNGCVATDMTGLTKVTVYGIPVSNAGGDDEVCLLNYQLNAVPSLGSGMWTQAVGRGITTFENNTWQNTNLDVSLAGLYRYAWTETNWECVDSDTVEVVMYQKPQNINAGSDTTLFFTDSLYLKGKYLNPDTVLEVTTTWERILGSAGSFENSTSKETLVYQLSDADNTGIILLWTISKGVCDDQTDSVNIKIKEIFTPTGFSPNGDGVNDYLKFNGLEHSSNNELTIYNRWGVKVYGPKRYSNDLGWDGKNDSNNDLPEDTYFYILKVTDYEGASELHKGFIVLKRN